MTWRIGTNIKCGDSRTRVLTETVMFIQLDDTRHTAAPSTHSTPRAHLSVYHDANANSPRIVVLSSNMIRPSRLCILIDIKRSRSSPASPRGTHPDCPYFFCVIVQTRDKPLPSLVQPGSESQLWYFVMVNMCPPSFLCFCSPWPSTARGSLDASDVAMG